MDVFYNLEMTEESIIRRMCKFFGDVHINTFKQKVYDANLSEKQRIKAFIEWSRGWQVNRNSD